MPRTEAQKRARAKYESKAYDQILLRVPKGEREEWQTAAAAAGMSLNAFIIQAVLERIADSQPEEDSQTDNDN